MRATKILALALVTATAAAGCKKDEAPPPPPAAPASTAPAINALTVGSAIGADRRVTAARDTLGLRDTVYVSVATTGTGDNQKLKAVWTFGSETVRADSQMVNLSGPAVTEFHISRPRAWPAGRYQVSVTLNDGLAQTRSFVLR